MNYNEFNKFARMHQGISSTTLSRYESAVDAYINPSIIEERKLNVTSMGSVLLCAGAKGKRSALPHSRVLIHQPLGGTQGQASDILIAAKEIEKLRTEHFTIISEHSGQPYDKVAADGERDFWMTAQEALEYGMVDQILTKK